MSQSHPVAPRVDFPGLRHQLLTPLNHIVGYSEMLLEEASTQQGFDHAQQNLARIRQTAKDMVRMVHSSLAPRAGKRGEKIVTELRYELAAPLHTILQAVGAVTGEQHEDMNVDDVLKIGHAAAELLSFAQSGTVMAHRSAMSSAEKNAPAQQTNEEKFRGGRVLIVDDNRANRELLARQLKRQGHQVTEAASGSQALQLLVQLPQDLVLLDMLMPKLDGFQVLERIKSDPVRGEIPVIVISALNEIPGVVRCLEMGAEDYLFKPLDQVLLRARIQSSLERKRLRDLEKRRAEDLERAYGQLHLSEERLRLALRADRARIWDWDAKTNRVTEAGGGERALEDTLSLVHPEDRDRVRAEALAALEKKHEFRCEFRLVKNGTRWAEAIGTPAGGERRMIGVTREITARKQVEEALLKSNREFQRFAMAASHDLREPLRAVAGELEALLGRRQGAENARVIRGAVTALGRMSKLTSDLLDYSQVSGKKTASQPLSAEAVLALVLSDLKRSIEEADAILTHDQLPVVSTDFVLLQRVFQNLLSNAIKYRGKERPKIHISARRENNAWLFQVSDNGVGIDAKDKDAIFGVFRRIHGNDVPGTGLGLAICRRIIERLGGAIWVESICGKGSTFSFTIPD
jgi:signal transduction histidine kinase